MRLDDFRSEILRFLAEPGASVLCISGKWGVGKTFAWNRYLKEAAKAGEISTERYAYVSLFGQNSLPDVRHAIFENTVPAERAGEKADLKTLEAGVETLKRNWRGIFKIAAALPKVGDLAEAVGKLGFFSVRNQVICIDDLERAGEGLETRDILGLTSFLKEERGCKVVLLLNDEALEENAQAEFQRQLEKVADTFLRFEPTAIEAAYIGVQDGSVFADELKEHSKTLGLVNIRIIKKIERFANRLADDLKAYDPRVLKQAVHTLSLGVAAKFEADGIPPLDFIMSHNEYAGLVGNQPANPQEEQWRTLLSDYSFGSVDDFDRVILKGVDQGHFDPEQLQAEAKKLERAYKFQDKDKAFSDAWDLYHGSFDDNADEVIDAMIKGIIENAEAISPVNFSGSISFLKELGRAAEVPALIEHYLNARNEDREFWEIGQNPFASEIRDPDVIAAFNQKAASFPETRDLAAVLKKIGRQNGYAQDDLAFLARHDADAYYGVFKSEKGRELSAAVRGALNFRGIINASPEMLAITGVAEEALLRIAGESEINRRRVAQRGVSLPPE